MTDLEEFPEFIRALPEVRFPFPGCRGWLIQGPGQQIVFVGFEGVTEVPGHSHAEQWEFVLAGEVVLNLEGVASTYRTGEHFVIPAGARHSAVVSAGYKAMMVFNSPDRYETMG